MKVGKGIVKKYSREYNRTLKMVREKNTLQNKFKSQYRNKKTSTRIRKKF